MTEILEDKHIDATTRLLMESAVCFYQAMLMVEKTNVKLREAWEEHGTQAMYMFAIDLSWEIDQIWNELPGDRNTKPSFDAEFCPAIVAGIDWTKAMQLYNCTAEGQISGHIDQALKIKLAAWAEARAVDDAREEKLLQQRCNRRPW